MEINAIKLPRYTGSMLDTPQEGNKHGRDDRFSGQTYRQIQDGGTGAVHWDRCCETLHTLVVSSDWLGTLKTAAAYPLSAPVCPSPSI